MSSRSPCTFAVPATRVFFGTTMFPACMGSSSRSFTACPSVRGLVLVYAGGYRVPAHSVARAYRRVEAVVSWLAVSPDKVGIAHGLLQSRYGRFPDCLHGLDLRLLGDSPGNRHLCHLPVLPAVIHVFCRQFVGLFQECHLVVSRRRGVLLLLQSVGQFRHQPLQVLFFLVHRRGFVERA